MVIDVAGTGTGIGGLATVPSPHAAGSLADVAVGERADALSAAPSRPSPMDV